MHFLSYRENNHLVNTREMSLELIKKIELIVIDKEFHSIHNQNNDDFNYLIDLLIEEIDLLLSLKKTLQSSDIINRQQNELIDELFKTTFILRSFADKYFFLICLTRSKI